MTSVNNSSSWGRFRVSPSATVRHSTAESSFSCENHFVTECLESITPALRQDLTKSHELAIAKLIDISLPKRGLLPVHTAADPANRSTLQAFPSMISDWL